MRPWIVRNLGPADIITIINAILGFVAVVAATIDPETAARIILLAAMGDGLDGVVARYYGGTPLGEHLDSLADVASFGVAPALLVHSVLTTAWNVPTTSPYFIGSLLIAGGFLAMAVVRLAYYTAHDSKSDYTIGVPSTLASTLLAAGILTGITDPTIIGTATVVLTILMIGSISYPDLLPRDTFIMGFIQGLAVITPTALDRAFPTALLILATAYLLLAPKFYWRQP